ncbi:MAG: excinuclease ABC subunit UvrB [Minisyncoccia bacterium]
MKNKSVFNLKSPFKPSGDQPDAISKLVKGLNSGMQKQTLLGATGTGKTFTMANVIQQHNKPTLVIAHNKTLAAQLAQEFREFFPDAAVHYFVSYYDYYQPEAYMPVTDTYIEKDAQINKEIDRLRHASTASLLTRKDVIIVASVSCIYGLGSPMQYAKELTQIQVGSLMTRTELMKKLVSVQFERTNADLMPAHFRSIGNRVDIMPVSETFVYQVEFASKSLLGKGGVGGSSVVSKILKIDPVTSQLLGEEKEITLFPAKHFMTEKSEVDRAIKNIKKELDDQLKVFDREGKLLEAERIKRRTTYDLAMIREVGYCSGIENYSRHLSGKSAGEPPETLLSYFAMNGDFLTIIDESHVTLPQLQGMYAGDQSRKNTLVEFGFRLPSAKDNRPLKYKEFEERIGQVVYVSATPGVSEKENSAQIVEQIIRPTGLLDPEIIVRPVTAGLEQNYTFVNGLAERVLPKVKSSREEIRGPEQKHGSAEVGISYSGQIQDFITEAQATIDRGFRVIATTLTKKMAEDLTTYLKEKNIKTEYLHSDVKTIDRIQILTKFRKGEFDVLVGVNLLREGLDLPEVALIGILDADKEGFLRSETSLIQTIGRAARNAEGRVILYADNITGSMERAIGETNRRRDVQIAYNKKHGITPKTILKKIHDITQEMESDHAKAVNAELDLDISLFEKLVKDSKKPKKVAGVVTEAEIVRNALISDEDRKSKVYEKIIKIKEKEMNRAVKELDFETAAILRDEIGVLLERMNK